MAKVMYKKCCICERSIEQTDGSSSLVSGKVHITCSNGAINYVQELAQVNRVELPHPFLRSGMVNHFRDNRESIERRVR